jgi:hypothetical protein
MHDEIQQMILLGPKMIETVNTNTEHTMHTSMTELFENLKHGLIWVGSDGIVRYANRSGARHTGLSNGRRIADPDLVWAVVTTAVAQVERHLTLNRAPAHAGGSTVPLACRVVPGPDGDDAFVFVGPTDAPDAASGVDSLMMAVRNDLRDPLRSAHAALEVARDAADGRRVDGLEFDALLDRVDRLLHVADGLVDLATLWNSGTMAADDRIELWPLLQRVWGEVEPQALARDINVRFSTDQGHGDQATLYGSSRWLRRVLVECLQAAVRGAEPGSLLEIEHVQMGPRAQIVLRDTRLFSGVSGSTGAVAQQLCRHVLALHGGRLREAIEGRSRHLVIELPTGAPHRSDESQLAVAQAQHYARDLAELMQRSRRVDRSSDKRNGREITEPATADVSTDMV